MFKRVIPERFRDEQLIIKRYTNEFYFTFAIQTKDRSSLAFFFFFFFQEGANSEVEQYRF